MGDFQGMADTNDELIALRRELEALRASAARMADRLDALERRSRIEAMADRQAESPAPIEAPAAQPKAPAGPPPLPARKPPAFIPPPAAPQAPAAAPRETKPSINWETWLGTVLIPRVGAFLLATAVVVGFSMAFQRMGPGGRVLAGYAICAALLGIGFWQERKYVQFGRILLGAGFALTYFVTYAAHYISFARIIESPFVDWVLLGAVALVWAATAQVRRSFVMASFALGLCHYTIYLSGPHRFAVAIVLVLAILAAFFLVRNGWYSAGLVGLAGAYINHGLWMTVNEGGGWTGFNVAMAALWTYFLLFIAAERFVPAEKRPKRFYVRSAYAALNSAAFLVLGAVTMDGFAPMKPHAEWFLFAAAAVMLLAGLAYGRSDSPMLGLYVTKAASVAVLGFAVAFEGDTFLAAVALEALILMLAARRSGLIVTRILSWALVAFTVFFGCIMAIDGSRLAYADPAYWSHAVPIAIVIAALYATAAWYGRTDWTRCSPQRFTKNHDLWRFAWSLDLTAEAPNGEPKPFHGRLVSSALALAPAPLILCYGPVFFANGHVALAWAVAGYILGIAACATGTRSIGFGGLAVTLAATAAALVLASETGLYAAIAVAVVLYLHALLSEESLTGRLAGSGCHRLMPVAISIYGAGAGAASAAIIVHATPVGAAFAFAALVAAHGAAALFLRREAMALVAPAVTLLACLWLADALPRGLTPAWHAAAFAVILAPILAERVFAATKLAPMWRIPIHGALAAVLLTAVASYIPAALVDEWHPFAWAIAIAAALAYGCAASAWLLAGAAMVLAALLTAVFLLASNTYGDFALLPLTLGYAAWLGFWIAVERALGWFAGRAAIALTPYHRGIAVAIVACVAAAYPPAIPGIGGSGVALGWTAVALAMYGLSVVCRERFYRFAGLVIFGLAVTRVLMLVFLSNMDRMYKVAAAFVLGVVLLAVSWGYFRMQGQQRAEAAPPPLPENETPREE